jgi:hypothetical protein
MGIFDGIEDVAAEGTSNRAYFEEGSYLVSIDRVFIHERRLGAGKLFVAETTVEKSSNQNIKTGERRNWVQTFALPYALPRIKAFIGAAIGLPPKEINSQLTTSFCDSVVSLNNPLKGKQLKLTCTEKTTSKGKQFVHHVWGTYESR